MLTAIARTFSARLTSRGRRDLTGALGIIAIASVATAALNRGDGFDLTPRPRLALDSIVDLSGRRRSLISGDSATLLILIDGYCDACRRDARHYVAWARRRRLEGTATMIIMTNERQTVAQFARMAGDTSSVGMAQPTLFERIGVREVPTVVLADAHGTIRRVWRRWPGEIRVTGGVSERLTVARLAAPAR